MKCLWVLLGSYICFAKRRKNGHIHFVLFRCIVQTRKELQPVKPWNHHLNATEEGPVCPQLDDLYGRLVNPHRRMSESCIHANVHVPMEALAVPNDDFSYNKPKKGLPILVFIHGGGFQSGSGDTDVHGPEYLVSKGIIVITFNYRINVFGFLSLNSSKIPGNNGLRDQVTLLHWVQRNARAFGGDPDDVTLAGQSAGSACAHFLSLSKVAQGLFKRVMLMSGTAVPSFHTSSPVYASRAANRFLTILGINSTDPDFIHDELIKMPLQKILNANRIYQRETLLVSFLPVLESKYPGITQIIDDNPINLIKQGRGKNLPILIGFTNEECEFFKRRLEYLDVLGRIKKDPLVILPAEIPFSTIPNVALDLASKFVDRYFHKKPTLEKYLDACMDTFLEYPAFKLAEWRAEMKAAPVFLYQFSYDSDYSVLKVGLDLQYRGSAHVEDLTYIFRENAILGHERSFPSTNRDDLMKDWMTQFVVNFMRCDNPTCGAPGWLPVHANLLNYQDIHEPAVYCNSIPTPAQKDMIKFFDKINEMARNSSVNPLSTSSSKGVDTTECTPVKAVEIKDTSTERDEAFPLKIVDIDSATTLEAKEGDYLPLKTIDLNTATPGLVKEEGEYLRLNDTNDATDSETEESKHGNTTAMIGS